MSNVIDVLKERGFIEAVTSEEVRTLAEKPLKVYCGFDPTADSLHLGSLVPIMGLAWFQRFGHLPVAVVGGATGMIGDPSWKSAERSFLDEETIQHNLKGIQKNLEGILNRGKALFLNNYDWTKQFTLIAFLRDVGKHFRMGPMLAKDSVRARLDSDEGMSFTEFSYQLLQGYDFLHLFDHHGVTVQIGGSDQWGNITAGTDLIRKMRGKSAFGITFPLLVRSDGQKFGKSEKGTIWLSPEKLSPYEFYQYLVRVPDADVIRLMCLLTFMEMDEIRKYETANSTPNSAQKRLAEEVTRIVHGEAALQEALLETASIAPGAETKLDAKTLAAMPNTVFPASEVMNAKVVDLLVKSGLQSSKGEARRLIQNGGVYINNESVSDEQSTVLPSQLIEGKFLLLAAGKKNKVLIRVE